MTKQTYLHEHHLKLGAKMVPFSDWDMPVQYTSVKEEVLAVRKNVGVFDVSHMGEFFLTGEDAVYFADYLLTNDIASAPIGKAIYSPLCRKDGTIIDDLIVYKMSEQKLLFCVNASNIEKDFTWMTSQLSTFPKALKCQLENKSSEYSLLALQGPKAFETLKKLPHLFNEIPDLDYYSVCEMKSFMLARTGYTGEDGFEIFGRHEDILILWEELLKSGVTPCGLAARDVLRLEVCYPLYGHELDDAITPYDSALSWTVKLQKNDFIGKEVLINKPQQYKLVKLILEKGIPREKYDVLNQDHKKIGFITSGTMSVILNKGIALARIDLDNVEELEKDIFVDIRGRKFQAHLTKKSFVTGGHK